MRTAGRMNECGIAGAIGCLDLDVRLHDLLCGEISAGRGGDAGGNCQCDEISSRELIVFHVAPPPQAEHIIVERVRYFLFGTGALNSSSQFWTTTIRARDTASPSAAICAAPVKPPVPIDRRTGKVMSIFRMAALGYIKRR